MPYMVERHGGSGIILTIVYCTYWREVWEDTHGTGVCLVDFITTTLLGFPEYLYIYMCFALLFVRPCLLLPSHLY